MILFLLERQLIATFRIINSSVYARCDFRLILWWRVTFSSNDRGKCAYLYRKVGLLYKNGQIVIQLKLNEKTWEDGMRRD